MFLNKRIEWVLQEDDFKVSERKSDEEGYQKSRENSNLDMIIFASGVPKMGPLLVTINLFGRPELHYCFC